MLLLDQHLRNYEIDQAQALSTSTLNNSNSSLETKATKILSL